MNDRQKQLAIALDKVTFVPGSYNKRFCRAMVTIAKDKPEYELSESQARTLENMYHRYRKQIKNHEELCSVCGSNHE